MPTPCDPGRPAVTDTMPPPGATPAAGLAGPPAHWPAAPRCAVAMAGDAPLPMCVAWGGDLATSWNARFAALLPAALAPGTPLCAALAAAWPDARDALAPLVERVLGGEGVRSADLPFPVAGAGAQAWHALALTPLRDEDGAVRGLACTVWETTDAVLARQRLARQADEASRSDEQAREAVERYRLARLATNDAIWDWRLNDGHVVWNRALRELFGHDLEQTSADWWLAHIHPEDRPHIDASIHAVIDGDGAAWSGEYRFRRADGSYAEIFDRGTVLRDAAGRPLRMIGAMVDLSERRATQRALHESERLFRTLFESIDEGFCVIEFLDGPHGPLSDYVHVMANPAYASNAGIEDVVGQRVRDMVPLEADGWVEIYRRVLLTGEPVRFERELERTGRYLELAALRIEPVERRQVAVLFQDITKRHRAELAMRGMNDVLERRVAAEVAERARTEDALRQAQKMEAVGKLTGGIAHDFNNMLAVISNALELLGRRAGADERMLQYVAMAKGGVRRASQLTQRLLAFSRQQPLRPVALAPNALVAGMSELLRHSLGADIAFETVLAPDAWPVHADPNQLENAILNLVVNARDAMERGGRLVIETANRDLDERAAAPGALAPGAYLMIAVGDTGAGMSAEVMARAFDPFFTTKEVGRGTGLGLSQVYGFVRQSGGHVEIDSMPGTGTIVRIYLPRHGQAPRELHAPAPAPLAGIPRARPHEEVLVVEDETAVRVLLADMLADLGYRVFVAEGGSAALQVLEAQPGVGLLLTDVVMPGMNGRELAEEALRRRPRLQVLFTTGYSRDIIGAGDVPGQENRPIAKPFALDELAGRVRAAFDAA
ncbi:PAS domain-containing protein [uncultured Massilia sp.]|uniref:PAS domain-containing protein n=1 Tax=uncultured Massilia sp. TaxID=169973 RepID=UPI0025E76BA8|nr:PAS domain-containing protein [uncultured Massilia sp.]